VVLRPFRAADIGVLSGIIDAGFTVEGVERTGMGGR
jgi:hypothetical protein